MVIKSDEAEGRGVTRGSSSAARGVVVTMIVGAVLVFIQRTGKRKKEGEGAGEAAGRKKLVLVGMRGCEGDL